MTSSPASYLICYNGTLIVPTYGYGLCACGCGGETRILYGKPRKFIHGHQSKRQGPDYEIRDCGYRTACWLWLKLLDHGGYARITVHGKTRRGSHAYYKHYVGPIPKGKQLDHLCRVRACVNPWHVEPISARANVRRGAKCFYTEDDIKRMIEMRKLGFFYRKIAEYFGTKTEYVQAICRGERWPGIVPTEELPPSRPHITKEIIEELVRLRKTGMAVPDISAQTGISAWNIYPLLRRNGAGRDIVGRRTRA